MPSPALQEIKLRVENLDEELSLLRSALEIVPEPVLVLNREKAFIKTLGKAEETLGYSWKELQKMVFIDLVDLEEVGKVRDGFDAMRDHPEVRLKTIVISRRGEKIPVELFGCLRGREVFPPPQRPERDRPVRGGMGEKKEGVNGEDTGKGSVCPGTAGHEGSL